MIRWIFFIYFPFNFFLVRTQDYAFAILQTFLDPRLSIFIGIDLHLPKTIFQAIILFGLLKQLF